VSLGLIWYAKSRIADRINQLTQMVDNPHLFKNSSVAKQKEVEDQMDEISRLVNIFAKFYNEEKVKGSSVAQKGRIDKKMSMLPMKSTINLYAKKPASDDPNGVGSLEALKKMFERDLGIEPQPDATNEQHTVSPRINQFALIEEAGEHEERDSMNYCGTNNARTLTNAQKNSISVTSSSHRDPFMFIVPSEDAQSPAFGASEDPTKKVEPCKSTFLKISEKIRKQTSQNDREKDYALAVDDVKEKAEVEVEVAAGENGLTKKLSNEQGLKTSSFEDNNQLSSHENSRNNEKPEIVTAVLGGSDAPSDRQQN
jgi:hypothetical protein